MGLYILIMAISTVIRIGRGTLAPWSPTKKLVTSGMYGYVRNPMITGVFIVLAGESLAMMSLNIFIWTIGFFLLNNIFFYVYEEPDLEKKFGDEYREYKKNVQRWIPKLISYQPQSQKNKSGNSG
jgi:protein-S-isoprenylcysteine O-methyltransferase Ste14